MPQAFVEASTGTDTQSLGPWRELHLTLLRRLIVRLTCVDGPPLDVGVELLAPACDAELRGKSNCSSLAVDGAVSENLGDEHVYTGTDAMVLENLRRETMAEEHSITFTFSPMDI